MPAKQLFLDLIRFVFRWSLNISVILEIVSYSGERVWVEKICLFGIFKIQIFIKYSLKVLAISTFWGKTLSFSAIVILEHIFGFIIFQKTYYLSCY